MPLLCVWPCVLLCFHYYLLCQPVSNRHVFRHKINLCHFEVQKHFKISGTVIVAGDLEETRTACGCKFGRLLVGSFRGVTAHQSYWWSPVHHKEIGMFFIKQRYGCQCWGSLPCAQMLMHAIAREGCTDTVREAALKIDSGRKTPCGTGELNLHQWCAGSMLYQLSYIPALPTGLRPRAWQRDCFGRWWVNSSSITCTSCVEWPYSRLAKFPTFPV